MPRRCPGGHRRESCRSPPDDNESCDHRPFTFRWPCGHRREPHWCALGSIFEIDFLISHVYQLLLIFLINNRAIEFCPYWDTGDLCVAATFRRTGVLQLYFSCSVIKQKSFRAKVKTLKQKVQQKVAHHLLRARTPPRTVAGTVASPCSHQKRLVVVLAEGPLGVERGMKQKDPVICVVSVDLLGESLLEWTSLPTGWIAFGNYANFAVAFCLWIRSAIGRSCPSPCLVRLVSLRGSPGDWRLLHYFHDLVEAVWLFLFLCFSSLLGFAQGEWRAQNWYFGRHLFPWARAASVIISGFLVIIICWGDCSSTYRTTTLKGLMTLFVKGFQIWEVFQLP